jgi:uncharacterized membrane protein YhaH (DUF805 family)/cold shock CspA family protein
MRGEILHYDVEQGIGFISAADGNRYMFSRNDLMQSQRVGKGTRIDFRVDGQNAREVYIVDPRGPAAQQARPAAASVPSVGQTDADAGQTGAAPVQAAPPLYEPTSFGPPDMNVWGYFMHCCTKGYADFSSRARRMEYWGFALFYTIAIVAVVLVGLAIDGALGNLDDGGAIATAILAGLAVLFFFVPTIAVNMRRFHDVGLSGWLYLLFIVLSLIYIGGIIIFVISLLPSQKHDNKWGPVPDGIRI